MSYSNHFSTLLRSTCISAVNNEWSWNQCIQIYVHRCIVLCKDFATHLLLWRELLSFTFHKNYCLVSLLPPHPVLFNIYANSERSELLLLKSAPGGGWVRYKEKNNFAVEVVTVVFPKKIKKKDFLLCDSQITEKDSMKSWLICTFNILNALTRQAPTFRSLKAISWWYIHYFKYS